MPTAKAIDAAVRFLTRRRFLQALAIPMLPQPAAEHPILSTIEPVVANAAHVRLHEDRVAAVADWMAYESLPWPDFRFPVIPDGDDADTMDFLFLTAATNFAFTDFDRHVIFTTEFQGTTRYDSDAMMACLRRAYDDGTPVLEGDFLANVDRAAVSKIFAGNIEIPMLDERVAIFREIGASLKSSYGERFHRFALDGPRTTGAAIQALVTTFPSFRDESIYRGATVRFHKRAQLLWWQLHSRFRSSGYFRLDDPEALTVFADYIVPVALRLLGITSYSDALEETIRARRIVPRDSDEEIEIRAAAIWGCELLTRAVNERRPADRQVIAPVVDTRLWTHYHESHWPHHLTVTTAY